MNLELIKKVFADAGFSVKESPGGKVNEEGVVERMNVTMFDTVPEWQMEKIITVIVQECVDTIHRRADTMGEPYDSKKLNEQLRQVQRDCATTLEYVFGLKEMEMSE